MDRKGQGALEYLLLIGGAILVAVIVISILVGLSGSSGSEAEKAALNAQCAKYNQTECSSATNLRAGKTCMDCSYNTSLSRCAAIADATPFCP